MATASTGTTNITINLDDSDVNSNVNQGGLIQQASYTKLIDEIQRDLAKKIKLQPGNGYPMGSGFVYFIDGTRGAGKTTFLKTVYDSAADDKSKLGTLPEKLGQLAYIDPSRIEHTEIILLFVLKELKRQVDVQLSRLSTRNAEEDYEKFRKRFKAIAGGLSLFQNDHDQLKDLDEDLFLDWGLVRAGDSVALRDNLHKLIDVTCKILSVSALLLAFDDADTNAGSAMKVLECICKYLDTPQLVVLVTGDMELYAQQVRDHFYDSMGKHLTAMDGERRVQRTKMVDHLEDQYLLKLFPIRRRIQLGPIWNLVEAAERGQGPSIQLSWQPDDVSNTRAIKSVINELIRRGLRVKSTHDIELYRSYLLKQPIRSILQVLSRCSEHLSKTDSEGDKSQAWDVSLSEKLSEGLRSMALGSLYKFGVDVDAIGAREMPALVDAVFELVVRDGEFDTGAYLRPQSRDIALKSSFASLAADVTRFCADDPSNMLLYMFGGPGSVALWGQVASQNDKAIEGGRIKVDDLRTEFKNYVGTGRREDALNWAWHISILLTAPYAANPKKKVIYCGVIGLNKRKPKLATGGQTAKSAVKVCAKYNSFPAFAFSLIDASGPGVGAYASIFNILGLMGRLLSLDSPGLEELNADIGKELAKVYQTPTISRPGWQGRQESMVDEDESEEGESSEEVGVKLENMTERVFSWLDATYKLRKNLKPSAVMIGKVWTRLYFSLEKVADEGNKLGAASLMELFALCVINAFLVEEFDHHLLNQSGDAAEHNDKASQSNIDGQMKRENPVSSPQDFAKKFSHPSFNASELPLTFLISSCPLILGLLAKEKNIQSKRVGRTAEISTSMYQAMLDKLSEFGASLDDLCGISAWNHIERSCIAGQKWPLPKRKVSLNTPTMTETIRMLRQSQNPGPSEATETP